MVKNEFFWNNSKNIDICILRTEQNLFRSQFYVCTKFGQNWLKNACQKSKMAVKKFSFFFISSSDRGDFPGIIVIALFFYLFYFLEDTLVACWCLKVPNSFGQIKGIINLVVKHSKWTSAAVLCSYCVRTTLGNCSYISLIIIALFHFFFCVVVTLTMLFVYWGAS